MKGILVTTDNTAEIRDFEAPLYKTIGEAVGGCIEIVHPMGLADPLVMVVNEEGLIQELPMNMLGSLLYGTHMHGSPIAGNIVVMKTGWTCEGPDIVSLSDQECSQLMESFAGFLKEG